MDDWPTKAETLDFLDANKVRPSHLISLFGDNSQIMTRVFGIRTDKITGRQVNFLPEETMLLDDRWVKPGK